MESGSSFSESVLKSLLVSEMGTANIRNKYSLGAHWCPCDDRTPNCGEKDKQHFQRALGHPKLHSYGRIIWGEAMLVARSWHRVCYEEHQVCQSCN